ncbi:phosphatase 2C-like domain-containing protein [Pelagophyceae sp. CCMP2097]|nr:phosphatase 2C-like domain-containing protein [Pelagophyceae sp. CCMP2097]
MAFERDGQAPVGEHAPTDLAGLTPCAWAAAAKFRDATKRAALEAALFATGDATVLPRTPTIEARGGDSRGDDDDDDAAAWGRQLLFAATAAAGWRVDMEDAHCLHSPVGPLAVSLFGVFDGHGGPLVADLAAERILEHVQRTASWLCATASSRSTRRCRSRRRSYRRACSPSAAASRCSSPKTSASGCTALLALVTPTHLIMANLGDSAAALCFRTSPDAPWQGKMLTVEHKPETPAEQARIERCGASVVDTEGTMRIQIEGYGTQIATSRALGDFAFKRLARNGDETAVSAVAELSVTKLADLHEDSLLVLACDGVWDVLDVTCSQIRRGINDGESGARAVERRCVQRRSQDNVTAVVVQLPAAERHLPAGPTSPHRPNALFGFNDDNAAGENADDAQAGMAD